MSASDALNLADADGDGADDSTVIGCEPDLTTEPVDNQTEDNTENNTENNSTLVDLDSDNDGILNDVDECPDTAEGAATDTQGCSNEQNKNQVFKDTEDDGLSSE